MLASASPRRHDLLKNLGCEFSVSAPEVDETWESGEAPEDYVERVARLKASAVLKQHPDDAILAADTTVAYHGQIFGKPRHQQHAYEMWQQLSDDEHQVITAVCLADNDRVQCEVVTTTVQFCVINQAQMDLYWQSGEPQDKAGGYAIQGLASAWVLEVHGSYSNVVGLPLFETNKLLATIGHNWL
jgi:septum formation protein